MIDELQGRLQAMNPEPFGDPSSDELADVLALIEARRSTMSVDEAPHTTRARAPMLRRPAFVVAGVMVFAILLIGGGVLLFGGTESPAADTTPTTTLTTTTAPVVPAEPTTTVAGPGTSTSTTMVALAPLSVSEGAGIEALATCPEDLQVAKSDAGTVVLASTYREIIDEDGVYVDAVAMITAWWSSDGQAWDSLGTPGAFDALEEPYGWLSGVMDVTAGPGGFVAVGNLGYDAAVWFSPDGVEWSRIEADIFAGDDIQSIHQVASGDFGYVAVGRNGSVAGVWLSPDGVTWSLVDDPDLGDGLTPVGMSDVAVGAAGLVAVGEAGFGSDEAGLGTGLDLVVWISPDGQAWEVIDSEQLPASEVGRPSSLSTTGEVLLLTGSPDGVPVVWRSTDGREWIDVQASFEGDGAPDVSGYAMVTIDESGVVWASSEFGGEPQPVVALTGTSNGEFGTDYELVDTSLIASTDELVIVGHVESDTGCDLAFWYAPWSG